MRKGTVGVVTGVVAGIIVGSGIYLYDKLKDSCVISSVRDSLKRRLSRLPIQEINLNSSTEYCDLEKELKENYKGIVEVQITLDEIKEKLGESSKVFANQIKVTEDNHVVTVDQLTEISKCVSEIKSILNGEYDTDSENKEEK